MENNNKLNEAESRVLVAMSGGVDSSVAAFLLKNGGYECAGATMRLFNNEDAGISSEKTCCSLTDCDDARLVCEKMGIPHYVFNFTREFGTDVIDKFIEAYEKGETPNPCIDCNRYLKFGKFLQRAKETGFNYIATGHYARIEKSADRYLLRKAVDSNKDQSYVLCFMSQYELAHTLLPLGTLTKPQVREIAAESGFVNAKKHESQDICFVPDGDYAKVIALHTGKEYPHGNFVDKTGNILGEHSGIIRYTIGQRKGLNIALGKPVYVCNKDIEKNEVVLGDEIDLYSKTVYASDFNWVAQGSFGKEFSASAEIRYRGPEKKCTVYPLSETDVRIEFAESQRAPAPGQAVVLYDGEYVIGGGKICTLKPRV